MNMSVEIVEDDDVIDSEVKFAARLSLYTESPIETLFGLAMYRVLYESDLDGWQLTPQFKAASYRIDWALKIPGKKMIFVECDGREFHTRPDQVERDRRRDARIRRAGITLFRFTGSEIFHDAKACALQVYAAATKL